MNISIAGLRSDWQMAAAHIVRLFDASADLSFCDQDVRSKPDRLELSIEVRLQAPSCEARITWTDPDGRTGTVTHTEPMEPGESPHKTGKRSMSLALLQTLQTYTGVVQPWGVLTGIRPMKLFHRGLAAGHDRVRIREQLHSRYRILPHKLDLMQSIASRQLHTVPDLYELKKEVSLYIGIPFCPTKCAYCTFPAYAIGGKTGSVDAFLSGLYYEMEKVGEWLADNDVAITSIYYGGGTPTSITAEEMDRLYTHMKRVFPGLDQVREVTVEAGRPDTITVEKLDVLRQHGIDRISINPQSWIGETLKAIGRHHTVEETEEKFRLARKMGMHNINMDLIIGLPGEGVDEFTYTLQKTAELMPESLTVHTLSFKRASEMTRNRTKYAVANPDEAERMMHLAETWTAKHGYAPYYLYRQKNILGNMENVGYARPGGESIYNIMIMEEMQSIIGLGCGAASKWVDPDTGAITRFANPKDPKSYNESFQRCTDEKLRALERLFLHQHTDVAGSVNV